jgi:hypothetical protein
MSVANRVRAQGCARKALTRLLPHACGSSPTSPGGRGIKTPSFPSINGTSSNTTPEGRGIGFAFGRDMG